MKFRVWAPRAASVTLLIGGAREDVLEDAVMDSVDGGWFEVEVPDAVAGIAYAFSLDGGPARPDPRSRSQPSGVDGMSQVVDLDGFGWTDEGWGGIDLAQSVVYELHVGTFSAAGTFDGVIDHLDHVVELGVDAVELMPVVEFSGDRGWGYDGVDLYAPHHAYGGPAGLQRLVDACHARGLAVILDVVYNHLGPAGNYLGEFGPYFTDRYATPWGEAINFDGADSDEVRAFFVDNAIHWLRDFHIDGLRLDAVHAILDMSAVHIVEEIAHAVGRLAEATGRRMVVVAESDLNDPRVVRPADVGGYGTDAQWSDDFHHALHSVLTGERFGYYSDFGSIAQLAKSLRQAFVYDGTYSLSRRRRHGRPPTGVPSSRFLGYAQNHDQIGNRARGERLTQLVDLGRLKVAAALVLCAPFVPMLFQGEEWGATSPFQYFTDHRDPELADAVREGRRREFAAFDWSPEDVPDPQDPATFERSRLQWDARSRAPHAGLVAWHRELIALRRAEPELRRGTFDDVAVAFDEDARWLVLRRASIGIACSFSDNRLPVPIGPKEIAVLASSSDASNVQPGFVELAPASALIFRQ